jgi:exodeoxyribonuclease-1
LSSARQSTFFWHDYETFGADPARDRPVQFAGVRTDAELRPLGEPLVVYCRPANDFLPQPRACLITGITPQLALQKGFPECQFISRIHAEMAQPGTCTVGYNSLRFDDEVTRHTLYRNFFDPYAREWQNGNSRWDIIDMLRTARALRPEGIEWPLRDDGLPSFRLEELTAANGIGHAGAHDALADVRATIAIAGLVRDRQPKLYDYLLAHRDKRSVLALLDIENMKPVLHVSGMFGAQRHSIALIVPLAVHPVNRNEVICYDLDAEPGALLELSADTLRERLYTRSEDLAEDCQRPGLKSVHINRCPVVLPAAMATPAIAARLGIEGERCRRHLAMLREYRQADAQGFHRKIAEIYQQRERPAVIDPDLALYSGGFFSDQDKRSMDAIRAASPEELADHSWVFADQRLPEMLFRYRARNFPDSLSRAEHAQWEEYRFQRLTDPDAGASICMDAFHAEIEALQADSSLSPAARRILEQLLEYSDALLA